MFLSYPLRIYTIFYCFLSPLPNPSEHGACTGVLLTYAVPKRFFFPSSYQLHIAFWLAYNFVSTFVRSFSETEPHVPWLTS